MLEQLHVPMSMCHTVESPLLKIKFTLLTLLSKMSSMLLLTQRSLCTAHGTAPLNFYQMLHFLRAGPTLSPIPKQRPLTSI